MLLQSQPLQVSPVDPAIREFDLLKIIVQRLLCLRFRWPILPYLFERRTRAVRKGDNRLPFRWSIYRCDTRSSVEFLVRPETPADVVLFQQGPEGSDPLIRIFTRLSHPNRHIVFVTEIKVLLNGSFVHVHPILVKSVGELIVKRRPKNFEVAVPLRAAEQDD